jgi:hypothetical protein
VTTIRVGALIAAVALVCVPPDADAQTAARRLTTIDSLRQFPGYYHLQNVLIRGTFSERDRRLQLVSDAHEITAVLEERVQSLSGDVEVRGQLVDVGRLEPSDPRVGRTARPGRAVDGPESSDAERWPRPGEELFLRVTGVSLAEPAPTPTIRALALEPWKFAGRAVTLGGSFRGRNLFGDLPDAPTKGRYDFVLRGAEGAIWVTGLRPRGRDFDLDVDRRADSGRWLDVTGTVVHERGLVRVEATRVALGKAPAASTVADEDAKPAAPPPPVEIVFQSPTEGDVDVRPGDTVRVQFSRGLAEPTLAGRVQARYADPGLDAAAPGASLEFKVSYDAANRAVEMRFPQRLQPGRMVRVEILEGVTAFDGGVVPPWTVTFTVSTQ